MEYTVVEVDGDYMLEDTDKCRWPMPRPWSSFLPGDHVILNPFPQLVRRQPRDLECIVYKTISGMIYIRHPKYPKFKAKTTSHIYLPVGTKTVVHLTKEGGIMPLNIVIFPKPTVCPIRTPILAPHIGLVYR
jgi:hypothetical protein